MAMVSATENISPGLGDHLQVNQGNHGHDQDHHLHKNPEVKFDLNGNSSTHHGHDHDHNLHENSELKSDLNGNSSTHDGYDHYHHLHENPEMKCEINENNSKEFSIKKNGKKAKEVKIVKRKKPTTKDQVVVSWTCTDCKTSQTPLWRTGPAGPRSLCNACGIKLRKKRKTEDALLEKERNDSIKKKQKQVEEEERELQKKYAGKEEVQAARLLMALSCGIWV